MWPYDVQSTSRPDCQLLIHCREINSARDRLSEDVTYCCTCGGADENRSLLAVAPGVLNEVAGNLIT